MRKYYGLRMMSVFYKALAMVIAIASIASIGFMAADAYLVNETIDIVPPDTISWTVQALGVLIIGGLSSLTCYVLGQLIDAQIETYKNTAEILQQIHRIERDDKALAQLLDKQIRWLRATYKDNDAAGNVSIPVERSSR